MSDDEALASHIHLITPGDHFSPRTGSAVPSVVHGLCGGAGPSVRSSVLVARGTYPDHYPSAQIIEYDLVHGARYGRYVDAARGQLGLPRSAAQRPVRAALSEQHTWVTSAVVAHNLPAAVAVVAARHQPVLYAHNNLLRSYSPWEAGRALGSVSAIIAVSNSLADQLLPHLPGRLQDRLKVVHNAADCETFYPTTTLRTAGPLRVTVVGRTIRDKGADLVIEAVKLLGRTDVELRILGSSGFDPNAPLTSFEEDMRRAAHGSATTIRFVPSRPRADVAAFLRESDVLVVPSRWPDPCPLTVLEGMATAIPVVAANIGGLPELLGDAGILVTPDSPASIAEALTALLDDEALRRQVGALGLTRAQESTWARSARIFADHLDAAI
ncbi:glycosyltransferase family 4 protein [Sanguibacter gelidistatuariae]|nr:glycosyltransferase family 4 protein [Sanguibacter gelidistatuariae]